MTHTHVTALTQFVDANGIRFAYRWFGKEAGTAALPCSDHENRVDFWSGDGLKAPVFLVIF